MAATRRRPDNYSQTRPDNAQLLLRMDPATRARIREGIPHGSLNAVAIRLLTEYAAEQIRLRDCLPLEDSAA